MAKKEDKPQKEQSKTDKPFKVQGWKNKEEKDELFVIDSTFEELVKLSVTDVDKVNKPKLKE